MSFWTQLLPPTGVSNVKDANMGVAVIKAVDESPPRTCVSRERPRCTFLDRLYNESDKPYKSSVHLPQSIYAPVSQSPLFTRLPREIGNQIYILIITTASDIPLHLRQHKCPHQVLDSSQLLQPACYSPISYISERDLRSPAAFLATCKAINKEATHLLNRHNSLTLSLHEQHHQSGRLGESKLLSPHALQLSAYILERVHHLILTITLVDSRIDHKVEKRLAPAYEILKALERGRTCRLRLQCHGACHARDPLGNSVGSSILGALCRNSEALAGFERVEVGVERTAGCRGLAKGESDPHRAMVEEVERRVKPKIGRGRYMDGIVAGEACWRVVFYGLKTR